MAYDFPSSPSVGEFYPPTVSAGDPQWIYIGSSRWQRLTNSGQTVSILVVYRPVVETTVAGLTYVPNAIYSFTHL
jgi:hypothetical protein